jgi:broad specificity phosphatase PhoE
VPTIYYIRHGQTEWNALGRLQGAQDIPLNELGREQSAHAGHVLADLFRRDGENASSIGFVASPLGRARQTMDLVRGVLKLPLSGYTIDDRLREIGYGEWEGSTLAEMQAKDPELFARRQIEKWTVAPPGGETYVAVQARLADWHRGLTADTLRALMVALGLETPESAADLPIEQGVVYVFRDGGLAKYS